MDASEGITIRVATPDDAEALTHLHLDCWDDAYTGLIPQEVLDRRRDDVPERIERWRAGLARGTTHLAEEDGRLVGFITAGSGRDELDLDLEIQAVYARASHWGRGVGYALLVAAVGDRPAYLWVLEGNDRAIAFYERQGFRLDGAVRDGPEGQHLRMVRGPRTTRDGLTMSDLLLVPSPLLGPATWAPVADVLRSRDRMVRVAAPGPVSEPTDIVDAVVSAAAGRDVVLVPHSNAGYYVPQLASVVGVVAAVFVDAALPLERGATTLAPADFLATLRRLADEDGVLPPWTEWWEDVSAVFPDPATRAAVEAEQKRLPLSYFTARLPVPDDWTGLPCAYLAFGDSYAAERAFASEHAWPTRTLVGGHLHQLHDPDTVAAAILDLLDALIP